MLENEGPKFQEIQFKVQSSLTHRKRALASEVLSDRIFYTMNSDPTKRRQPRREGGGERGERGRRTSCLDDPRIKCSRFKNEQLPHSVHFPCMDGRTTDS